MGILGQDTERVFQTGAEVPAESVRLEVAQLHHRGLSLEDFRYFKALLPVRSGENSRGPLRGGQFVERHRLHAQLPGEAGNSESLPDIPRGAHPASFDKDDPAASALPQDPDERAERVRVGGRRKGVGTVIAAFQVNVLAGKSWLCEHFPCQADRIGSTRALDDRYRHLGLDFRLLSPDSGERGPEQRRSEGEVPPAEGAQCREFSG